MKVYDSISGINKNQWNSLVEHSKLGSFFHRYEWLESIENGIGLKAKHIVLLKNDNPISIFPNFIICIKKTPFKRLSSINPGFGGPVITSHEKEASNLMLKNISKICRGSIISHYISTLSFGYVRYGQYFEKEGYQPNLGSCRFIIDLNKNYEDIKSSMGKGKRWALNKISKKDIDIRDENICDETLKNFYEIYKKAMKRVGGNTCPFQFFISLENSASERIKIFTAVVEEKEVGKHLYILDREQSSLHHFFSAIDEPNFKYYPSELIHEYAIKWGIENNYKIYDFGGTDAKFDNGLFKFKEDFGGQVVPTLSWEKGYSKLGWSLFKIGRSLYRKLGK